MQIPQIPCTALTNGPPTTAQEQEQLAALRESASKARDNDFEGGFGGQEDLEDRYATTSGEH